MAEENLSNLREQLYRAVITLSNHSSLPSERLIDAYVGHLRMIPVNEELPSEVRERMAVIKKALDDGKSFRDRILSMSDAQLLKVTVQIVDLYQLVVVTLAKRNEL